VQQQKTGTSHGVMEIYQLLIKIHIRGKSKSEPGFNADKNATELNDINTNISIQTIYSKMKQR